MRSVQRFILLLAGLGMCVLATKIVSAKAVGIWLFDEGKGDTVKEAQGYKHDGEFVGGVKWEKAGRFRLSGPVRWQNGSYRNPRS